jgi:hypothetical protein
LKSILFLGICAGATSCVEDNSVGIDDEDHFETEFQMAESLLKPYAQTALILASNNETRSMIYSEVDKKFDGDDNILFDHLLKNNLPNQRLASLIDHKLETSMMESKSAISTQAGEELFPQIYIPYFENISNDPNARSASNSSPLVVIFNGDETIEELPAYKLDEQNNLVKTNIMVDEDYAFNNEVWVISLNERIEADPTSDLGYAFKNDMILEDKKGDLSFASQSATQINGSITNLKIQCRKESWANGKHEVNVARYVTFYGAVDQNGNAYFNSLSPQYQHDHMKTATIRKRDVKNGKWKNIDLNHDFTNNWTTDNGEYMAVSIFECDNWPAARRQSEVNVPGYSTQPLFTTYRSADPAWITKLFAYYDGNLYWQNGCIKVTGSVY